MIFPLATYFQNMEKNRTRIEQIELMPPDEETGSRDFSNIYL